MDRALTMKIGRRIAILSAAVALAIGVYGGSALLTQPAMADTGEGYAITVNDGASLEKFEGQDNYWKSELQYDKDGDKSGDLLIYTLEDPENVPVGMEINLQFTTKGDSSEDVLQIQGAKSGDLIDLNLEKTDEGWNGMFLMPEEDIDITVYTKEAVDPDEEDAVKSDSEGPAPEDGEDDTAEPAVNYGFIINNDSFIDQDENGVWYYEFDHGKVYLDDSKSFKLLDTEVTDEDYTMEVKIKNHTTGELFISCGGDDSIGFQMPEADLDIEVTFEKKAADEKTVTD